MPYNRSIDQLEAVEGGNAYWPQEISEAVAEESPAALLLTHHDAFLKLLAADVDSPDRFLDAARRSGLPGNLLLKHSVVLADVGGESLSRLGSRLGTWFPIEEIAGATGRFLRFKWRGREYVYRFRCLPVTGLGNTKLGLVGPELVAKDPLSDLQADVMMLVFFGGSVISSHADATTALEKCILGRYLGDAAELDSFMRSRYLEVSRITSGAKANSLGQVLQAVVKTKLQALLGDEYTIKSNGKIEGISFDVAVERGSYRCGIEVAFQVTTNSVIERKGNEAEGRRDTMHAKGHSVAFVLDGAGIFQRRSAVTKICESSDCTVRFSDEELAVLAKFIKERAALK